MVTKEYMLKYEGILCKKHASEWVKMFIYIAEVKIYIYIYI